MLSQGFPVVGKQLMDAGVGLGGDAGEDVAQVGEGVELMAFGALDEAVEDRGECRAARRFGPTALALSMNPRNGRSTRSRSYFFFRFFPGFGPRFAGTFSIIPAASSV